MNGVLNLSVLDGWFDEAYEISGSWAIGDREPYSEDQDAIHASNIYYLLESEIVPLYYAQSEGGLSTDWVRRMKECIMNLTPQFDARRMVNDYLLKLYDPSHANWMWMEGGNFEEARSRARWNARVREVWPQVRFVDMGPAPSGPVMSGKPIQVRAAVFLAGLKPEDVRVECLVGAVSAAGNLENTEVLPLPGTGMEGEAAIFEREIVPHRTGRLGYAVRISPNHDDNPLTRPVTSLLKWGGR
jgi:starch phosphorylase